MPGYAILDFCFVGTVSAAIIVNIHHIYEYHPISQNNQRSNNERERDRKVVSERDQKWKRKSV